MQQDGDDDMVGIFTFKVQNLGKYWFKKKQTPASVGSGLCTQSRRHCIHVWLTCFLCPSFFVFIPLPKLNDCRNEQAKEALNTVHLQYTSISR